MTAPTAHATKGTQVSQENKTSLLEGFKAFLMRGNVVDLAVAVVIGAAFTNIVNSIVKGVISPLVGAFGTKNLDVYQSCLKGPCVVQNGEVTSGVAILWGSVLSATLSFLITAAVVYFLMVLPMAKYLARKAAREKELHGGQDDVEITELDVLKDIRDALVRQRGDESPAGTGVRTP
jgi:large conductance mechanosensitive channel